MHRQIENLLGGQQGWSNLWKAHGSLHSHQKVAETFRNMISSPSGKWLRRLHECKSKIISCHCRPSQPCHGDVIVRLFAEALAEEKRFSLCEVGCALKSHVGPVSPEFMQWMFGRVFSYGEGRKVKSAESSQPTFPHTASAAQQTDFRQLKRYVGDFVRGPVVPSEDLPTQNRQGRLQWRERSNRKL